MTNNYDDMMNIKKTHIDSIFFKETLKVFKKQSYKIKKLTLSQSMV